MAESRFDDKEVAQILNLAAAMQSEPSHPDGVTLSELQRIAEEVGISPASVARAVDEIHRTRSARSTQLSDSLMLERTVNGPLSEETWEELVSELRSYSGSIGQASIVGESKEWRGGSELGGYMLSGSSRNGRTRLKLLANARGFKDMVLVISVSGGVLVSLIPTIVNTKTHALGLELTLAFTVGIMLSIYAVAKALIWRNRKLFFLGAEGLIASLAQIAESEQGASAEPLRIATQPLDETMRA